MKVKVIARSAKREINGADPKLARRNLDPKQIEWPAAEVPRQAVAHSLPTALVRHWADYLPAAEVEALAAAMGKAGSVTLRANLHKCSRDVLAHSLRKR